MSMFTVGASEFLRRAVYPPFVSLWTSLRNLTGRQTRADKKVEDKAAAGRRRDHKELWKESHGR
jgi:hypothetical protein